jgi:hypothetical protein
VFRWVKRWNAVRGAQAKTRTGAGSKEVAVKPAEDMLPCPKCGAYAPSGKAVKCARADCPYPAK